MGHTVAHIEAHDNGYTVSLHDKPKPSKGRYTIGTYTEPQTHVAETPEKAVELVKGHLAKQGAPEGKKTDKVADAAKKGYAKMMKGDADKDD